MKGRSEDMAADAGVAAAPKQVTSDKSGRETLVSLDVRHETRTFPGVNNGVPKIVAMPARFRSLYPSDIDMWYDARASSRVRRGKTEPRPPVAGDSSFQLRGTTERIRFDRRFAMTSRLEKTSCRFESPSSPINLR